MKKQTINTSRKKEAGDNALDRDQPGPVSVSPEDSKTPSYTHNADKSAPIDPHLYAKNKPASGESTEKADASDKVLDRDQPGPVSVSPKDQDKPSYPHNTDESEPIDPNPADQSEHSKKA